MTEAFVDQVLRLFEETADHIKLDKRVRVVLREPKRTVEFSIPVPMDDGTVSLFRGYRVQHNDVLGPYKGGIRFSPEVDIHEVRGLAMLMTWKTSLLRLSFGGAKGGVTVDPHKLSESELERLSRGYIDGVYPILGPERDIPAPDLGTTPQVMAWMMDEYSRLSGYSVPASVTGKPVELGGVKARLVSTGFGGAVVLRAFLKDRNFRETTVAVQGFGNVGSNVAKYLARFGFRVVAVSDSKGGIYHEQGIDIEEELRHQKETGKLNSAGRCWPLLTERANRPVKCDMVTNEELLELPVDVLIPAAVEGVVSKENAKKVQAKVVLEMANAPVTEEAEGMLVDMDIVAIPDILANAGGVVGSYFEWAQNFEKLPWQEKTFLGRLERSMEGAFKQVRYVAKEQDVDLRKAAHIVALSRLSEAVLARGFM